MLRLHKGENEQACSCKQPRSLSRDYEVVVEHPTLKALNVAMEPRDLAYIDIQVRVEMMV